ncbi:protein adenylyltransferase SelO [Leptothrix sp. BB-4]
MLAPLQTTSFDPATLTWLNRHAALGATFGRAMNGQPVPQPEWLATSDDAAEELGWPADWWRHPLALDAHSGGPSWPGSQPFATVYSGHQFGVWAGQLGDGRALLLGEVETPHGTREIQLKGSGMTPYSRRADGRAVLRSSIREYLCSEAMAALGIPTTRALALVGSPLPVRREEIETAAVVTRTAPSFIRFGHFEHFCHHDQHDALRHLMDHVLDHHLPACRESAQPAVALLECVSRRTAELMAQWQAVGFCHGVMNTDNMSILGLTIDYGPFGFLDGFDPGHICNHSDERGRYAYARQPQVAWWNLHALAQALIPLVNAQPEQAAEVLGEALQPFREIFPVALDALMRAKLGLTVERPEDRVLIEDLLQLMATTKVDYTLTWRRMAGVRSAEGLSPAEAAGPVRDLFLDRAAFDAWLSRYLQRLHAEGSDDGARRARMLRTNPAVVLRNHLAEEAIQAARDGNVDVLKELARLLRQPFDERPDDPAWQHATALPPDWAAGLEVSCSS